MAQKTVITYIDDLDGGRADETVQFALDGTTYEIDLSAKHAATFRKAFASHIEVARVTSRTAKKSSSKKASRDDLAAIRAWARKNGWKDLPQRGRIPGEVRNAYDARNRSQAA